MYLQKISVIIKKNINWLMLSIIFFAFSCILSYFSFRQHPNLLLEITGEQKELLRKLAELIFNGTPLQGIIILFTNNFLVTLQNLFLGVILGIIPLIALLTNGSLLGGIGASLVEQEISFIRFTLAGILPHGIFELPAFFLSTTFGLKLGYHIIFPLPQKKRWESFKIIWREIFYILPLIIILLLISAIIEVLVTPIILEHLI